MRSARIAALEADHAAEVEELRAAHAARVEELYAEARRRMGREVALLKHEQALQAEVADKG